jgi:hypothetical protein
MWLLRVLAWVGLPSWVAPLLIAGAIAAALGGAYIKGRMDSAANCRERELAAVIASMERDRQIALEADRKAKELIKRLEEQAKKDDEEIAKYAEELRSRPDRCDLTPGDVNRLLNTRGR